MLGSPKTRASRSCRLYLFQFPLTSTLVRLASTLVLDPHHGHQHAATPNGGRFAVRWILVRYVHRECAGSESFREGLSTLTGIRKVGKKPPKPASATTTRRTPTGDTKSPSNGMSGESAAPLARWANAAPKDDPWTPSRCLLNRDSENGLGRPDASRKHR